MVFFVSTKKHAYTRELLNMWLWDVCGGGNTFRDAYLSWASKSCAASASFNKIGNETVANRQLSNEAFTLYIKTLKFQSDNDLFKLFRVIHVRKRQAR